MALVVVCGGGFDSDELVLGRVEEGGREVR